jgi:hypothetical protein
MSISRADEEMDRRDTVGINFQPMKVLICVDSFDVDGPSIRILHAQQDFYSTFGYSPADLPLPLLSRLSEASARIV